MKNPNKRVKGLVPRRSADDDYDKDAIKSPYLRALENPDILSDESRMFPERDFEAEQARAVYIEKFKRALTKLTPKQKAIIETMDRLGDQQMVADELGVARTTVAMTLAQIQKKISKLIDKM